MEELPSCTQPALLPQGSGGTFAVFPGATRGQVAIANGGPAQGALPLAAPPLPE